MDRDAEPLSGTRFLGVAVSRHVHDGGVVPGETSDWDEAFYETLGRAVEKFIERGVEPEDAVRRATLHFTDGLSTTIGPSIAESLREAAPEMLAEHYVLNREFEDRLHERWGKALDLYYMVAVAAQEFGATGYQAAVKAVGTDNEKALLEALTGVHARSCRTAFTVYGRTPLLRDPPVLALNEDEDVRGTRPFATCLPRCWRWASEPRRRGR